MGLVRTTPLLTTIAEVVDLTAVQDLASLESDSEFSVADTLLRAHEWVFDRLKARLGRSALGALTNETELERAVAWRFLEIVSAAGYLGDAGARAAEAGGRGYYGEQAREELDNFAPEYSGNADAPRRSTEGIPAVGHLDGGAVFFGDLTSEPSQFFSDSFPSSS